MKPTIQAAAASFAHLLGRAPKAARAEEDDKKKDDKENERKQRADESDEDYAKRMEELDDKEDAAKADDDHEGGEEEDKGGKKSKKSEDGDEDDDKDMKADKAIIAARRRERARCAAIFADAAAGQRPDLAAHLAFQTEMSRTEAVAMLQTVVAGDATTARSRNSLGARMADAPKVAAQATVATAPGLPSDPVAASIIMMGKRRRGEA